MKTALIFVSVLLVASAPAQQHDEPHPNGVIYGTAVDKDGNPAKNIGLTACPLGVALSAILPHTTTNARGEYRFENLPWWGRYAVYPEEREAGYSEDSATRRWVIATLKKPRFLPESPKRNLTLFFLIKRDFSASPASVKNPGLPS